MGGKNKGGQQEINEYQLSQHIGFGYGPFDYITRLWYGEKVFWRGAAENQTFLNIDVPNLFGGPKKEGGVSGFVALLFGKPDQLMPDALAERLGKESGLKCPGFRGITSLFFVGPTGPFTWQANTPYLKPIWLTGIRAPKGEGLDSSVSLLFEDLDKSEVIPMDGYWKYLEGPIVGGAPPNEDLYVDPNFDDSGWLLGQQPFANATHPQSGPWPTTPNTVIEVQHSLWLRKTGIVMTPGVSAVINIFVDNEVTVYWNGVKAAYVSVQKDVPPIYTDFEPFELFVDTLWRVHITVPGDLVDSTNYVAAYFQDDTYSPGPGIDFFAAGLAIVQDEVSTEELRANANPAHIIYECMTNTDFGLGESPDLFDVDSFNSAAQVMYDEGLMLSMIWSRQSAVEEFNNEVLKHINGVVFTNPRNGLHTLRLIRGGYDESTLRQINPDNARITKFSRRVWGQTTNEVTVTWTEPLTEKEETVTVQDLANISIQGKIVPSSRNYYGVRSRTLATELAYRELRVASSPLCTVELELDRTAWDILPGDVVALTWPEYNLVALPMRVGTVDYGQIGSSQIRVNLTEDVFALPISRFEVAPPSPWQPSGRPPAAVSTRQLFTLPAYATALVVDGGLPALAYPAAYLGVAAQAPNSDSSSFELVGQTVAPNGDLVWEGRGTLNFTSKGLLTDAIPAQVETDILSFTNLSGEGPTVAGFVLLTSADTEEDSSEFALVQSYDESTGFTLKRGILDTVPRAWPAGTRAWFIDANSFAYDAKAQAAGGTPSYKFLTNTTQGQLALASSPVYEGVVTERPHLPLRPANMKVADAAFGTVNVGSASFAVVTWATRNRLTEESIILDWEASSTPPEAGQTTVLVIYDTTGAVIDTVSGLTGTSFNLPLVSYADYPIFKIRAYAERDGLRSLQAHEMTVTRTSGSVGTGYTKEGLDVALGAAKWAVLLDSDVYAVKDSSLKRQDDETLEILDTRPIIPTLTGLTTDGEYLFTVDRGNAPGGLAGKLRKHSPDLSTFNEMSFPLLGDGNGCTYLDDSIWVSLPYSGVVRRYAPSNMAVQADITVSLEIARLTSDESHVYGVDRISKKAYKLDPATNTVALTITLSETPIPDGEIAVANGLLFVACADRVMAYDITTGVESSDVPLISAEVVNAFEDLVAFINGSTVTILDSSTMLIVGLFAVPVPSGSTGFPQLTLLGENKLLIDNSLSIDYYTYRVLVSGTPRLFPMVYAGTTPIAFVSAGDLFTTYESTDGGLTFEQLAEAEPVPISDNVAYTASLDDGTYLSIDATKMHSDDTIDEFFLTVGHAGSPPEVSPISFERPTTPVAIASDGDRFIIICEGDEVFETTDGVTLTSLGVISGTPGPFQSSFINGGIYGWASNYASGVNMLKRAGRWFMNYAGFIYWTDSEDPVTGWTLAVMPTVPASPRPHTAPFRSIVETGGNLFTMGQYYDPGAGSNVQTILKSVDSGTTWTIVLDHATLAPDIWKIGSTLIAPGYFFSSKTNISTDGGTTWTQPSNSLPAPLGYGLFADDKIIYAVSDPDAEAGELQQKLIYTTDGITAHDVVLSSTDDPDFASRSLILHMEGANGSTVFVDSSSHAFVPSVYGPPVISTAQKRYGGSSMYQTSGGLLYADDGALRFGAEEFALEASIYLTDYANDNVGEYQCAIITKDEQATLRSFSLCVKGTATSFTSLEANVFYDGGGIVPITASAAFSFALNTWYDVCLQRKGNVLQLFVNGTQIGSDVTYTGSVPGSSASVKIGALLYNASYPYYFKGYIDEVRITNGVAPYDGNYVPAPFPDH